MKRSIILSIAVLLMIQGLSGILPPHEGGGSANSTHADVRDAVISPRHEETRQVDDESDDLGGSWLDDFTDKSGIEWEKNVEVVDGKLEIDWLTGWNYRRSIVMDNSGGALSDHTISINLTPQNFNYLMAGDDGEDIRFSTLDGKKLNYWIERWDPQGKSTLRVNVTDIPNGISSIWMYYGNPAAESESDGGSVFDFFDDFSGQDNAKWSYTTGHSYGFDTDGSHHGIWFSGDANNDICTRTTSLFDRNIVIESELNKNHERSDHFIFISDNSNGYWSTEFKLNYIQFLLYGETKYILGQNDYSNIERPDEDIYRVRMTV